VPPRSPKKPEPPFATTEEMVAITNVERQTLRQWVRRGLLPPAKIVSDGNGVKSRWPRVALEQARFIKEMRAQLYSLDEILPMVLERWGTDPASTRGAAVVSSADRPTREDD
jgi:DNA-binding transcriptional MerR regulator